MNKQRVSPSGLAVIVGFSISVVVLLVYLWSSFGGPVPLRPEGYRLTIPVPPASRLISQVEVRVAGVPVGHVVRLIRTRWGSRAVIQLDDSYAPVRSDARAIVRTKTLLGEPYIEMTLGTRGAPALPDGALLPKSQVLAPVEFDEVLGTFDSKTRVRLRAWMDSWSKAVHGRGRDISAALGALPDFAINSRGWLAQGDAQREALRTLVSSAATILGNLGERSVELRRLIRAGDAAFAITAARNQDVEQILRRLPAFLNSTQGVSEALSRATAAARPVIADLRPAVPRLRPVLARTRHLAPVAGAAFRRLLPIAQRGDRNLSAAARLLAAIAPLLDVLSPVNRDLNPTLRYLALYRNPIAAAFANTAAANQAAAPNPSGAAPLHYLRALLPVSNEAPVTAEQRLPTSRYNPYPLPGHLDELGRGLRSLSCANTSASSSLPALGGTPPCRTQSPLTFDGATRIFPHLSREPVARRRR